MGENSTCIVHGCASSFMDISVLDAISRVAPPGFEPGSWHPECHMMDHYTKGLYHWRAESSISEQRQIHIRNLAIIFACISLLGLIISSVRSHNGVSTRAWSSSAVGKSVL